MLEDNTPEDEIEKIPDQVEQDKIVDIAYTCKPEHIEDHPWEYVVPYFRNYEGNAENTVIILSRFGEGIVITAQLLKEEGVSNYMPPSIAIIDGDNAKSMSVEQVKDGNVVLVSKYFLSTFSKWDTSPIGTMRKSNGEAFFRGSVRDFAFLVGVEEAHHAYYSQTYEHSSKFIDGSNMLLAEYDSTDVEYAALLFQLKVAKRVKLHEETIDFLEQRIDAATEFRRKAGISE